MLKNWKENNMERINNFMILSENKSEFDMYMQDYIADYTDLISYLKLLSSDSSEKLFNLIISQLEFLDSKNILLDIPEIKKEFGLNGKLVKNISESNSNDNNQIELSREVITLLDSEANKVCMKIHDELLKYILELNGNINI